MKWVESTKFAGKKMRLICLGLRLKKVDFDSQVFNCRVTIIGRNQVGGDNMSRGNPPHFLTIGYWLDFVRPLVFELRV